MPIKIARRYQPIVKSALQAIVEGDWDVGARIEKVGKAIAQAENLTLADKKILIKAIRQKLGPTLRAHRGLIRSAATLDEATQERLSQQAHNQGAVIVENQTDPSLIAGFQYQLGDDRWDFSLLNKLNQFKS